MGRDDKGRINGTAVILAGGISGRMGVPKAFIKVGGVPIIQREIAALHEVFEQLIIVAKDPAPYSGLGIKIITDSPGFEGISGPIKGVFSGLSEIKSGYAFVVGCDMPFISPGLVRWMAGLAEGSNLVIPEIDGYIEPLFGFYPKSALPVIEKALERGTRRLRDIFIEFDVRYAGGGEIREHDPELLSLINVNTPDDLARAEELLKRPLIKSSMGKAPREE